PYRLSTRFPLNGRGGRGAWRPRPSPERIRGRRADVGLHLMCESLQPRGFGSDNGGLVAGVRPRLDHGVGHRFQSLQDLLGQRFPVALGDVIEGAAPRERYAERDVVWSARRAAGSIIARSVRRALAADRQKPAGDRIALATPAAGMIIGHDRSI